MSRKKNYSFLSSPRDLSTCRYILRKQLQRSFQDDITINLSWRACGFSKIKRESTHIRQQTQLIRFFDLSLN